MHTCPTLHTYMPHPTHIHAPPLMHTCPTPHTFMCASPYKNTAHTLFHPGPTVGCYALCPTDMLYWNNSARYYSIYFDGLIIIASAPPSLNPHPTWEEESVFSPSTCLGTRLHSTYSFTPRPLPTAHYMWSGNHQGTALQICNTDIVSFPCTYSMGCYIPLQVPSQHQL